MNKINEIETKTHQIQTSLKVTPSLAMQRFCYRTLIAQKVSELAFSRILTEYGEIRSISPYSVRKR